MEEIILGAKTQKDLFWLLVTHFDRVGFPSGFVDSSWDEYLHEHIKDLDELSISILKQAIDHWHTLPEYTI